MAKLWRRITNSNMAFINVRDAPASEAAADAKASRLQLRR
jgi:hypothetical protein